MLVSKEVSSTIFWVFRMTRPEIELWCPEPLTNIFSTRPILLVFIYIDCNPNFRKNWHENLRYFHLYSQIKSPPFRWNCGIRWLSLFRGVRSPWPQWVSKIWHSTASGFRSNKLYFDFFVLRFISQRCSNQLGLQNTLTASLQRGKTLPTSVLYMILNNMISRRQECLSFGECRVCCHCHRSQVHSGPEW